MGNRAHAALYCFSCIDDRRKSKLSPLAYRGNLKRLKVDGVYVCVDCKTPIVRNGKRGNVAMRCHSCRLVSHDRSKTIMAAASHAVYVAIVSGALKPATEHSCVDCGAPATCYDHRDYSKPLEVEPVCRACNVCRGPGINRESK
jgi:DNA-directed RNA polymerase subunit RPC12/RpoP